MELESFVKSLGLYNITLQDLVRETPKHADTRLMCARITRVITGDPILIKHLLKYRVNP